MNWYLDGKLLNSIPSGYYGFIYELTYKSGRKYIGQKSFYNNLTLPALKSGEVRPNAKRIGKNVKGKRMYFDLISKESNWKSYEGSKKDIGDEVLESKKILTLCPSKRSMTYLEVKHQFINEVLESQLYLNSNILGKFYKDNLE